MSPDDGAPTTNPAAPPSLAHNPALALTDSDPATTIHTVAPVPPGTDTTLPTGTGAGIAAAAREARRSTHPPTRARHLLVTRGATFAVLGVVFVIAAGLAWWSMPDGPLSGNDSITYLGVARNLVDSKGATSPFGHELTGMSPAEGGAVLGTTPLTAWPPLYPIALASGQISGITVESTSRLLNVLACGAAAVLTALLARRMGASAVAGALGAVLLVVNLAAVLSFAAVGSEALFLPLELLALVALARASGTYGGEPGRALDLTLFVVAASAATLTRHAGVALIITGVIVLSAGRSSGRSLRLGLGVGAAASALPALAYLWARNQPGWRSPPRFESRLEDLPDAARAVATWLVPDRDLPAMAVAILVMALVAACVAAAIAVVAPRRHHPPPFSTADPAGRAPWQPAIRSGTVRRAAVVVVFVHAIVYVIAVGVSASLLDHGIPFDARLALPLLPPTLALLAAGADALVNAPYGRAARLGAAVAVLMPALALVVINVQTSREQIWSRPPAGVWTPRREYPTMQAVAALPADTTVFANQPSAAFALSGRPLLALPVVRSPMTGTPNPNARRDIEQLAALLAQRRAVVVLEKATVWLHARTGEPLVGEGDLRALVPLKVLADDDRFVVLGSAQGE